MLPSTARVGVSPKYTSDLEIEVLARVLQPRSEFFAFKILMNLIHESKVGLALVTFFFSPILYYLKRERDLFVGQHSFRIRYEYLDA